ncbi:MAG: sodium-dependent transporter [Chlamydiae bacterium]|nr:sodium-dependent transporter [Chlamydiota bacterium]
MKQQREHWASRLGFILAAAGSAIGVGSIWRFPYVVGEQGGGAFVLLYILFTFIIGLPLFIAELMLGRKSQKAAIGAYTELSHYRGNWKMLGWLNLISCFIILAYYSVVAGWCGSYFVMSLTQFSLGKSPAEIRAVFDTLFTAPGINLLWLAIFIGLNIAVVYAGVRKGIEYWSKILTPALFIIVIGLLIYATTMSGFSKAVNFLFYPDFSKLTPTSILEALGLAFFTLSVGLGIILTYGSYMQPKEDLIKNGSIVSLMTLLMSIIAALIIFPIVFTFDFPLLSGPGLAFKTMPVLFAKLPGTLLISSTFFLLLLFAALTSSISLFEMLVANLIELCQWSRAKACVVISCVTFLLGIPCALSGTTLLFPEWTAIYGKNFFDTMNYLTQSWMMPIAGLSTTVFVGWVLRKTQVKEEFMSGTAWPRLFGLWLFCTRFLCPIAIVIILLQEAGIVNLVTLFSSMKT